MEGSDDIHNHEMLNRPNIYRPDKIHVTDTEEKQTLQLVRGVKSSNPCFISYIRQLSIGSVRRLVSSMVDCSLKKVLWLISLRIGYINSSEM